MSDHAMKMLIAQGLAALEAGGKVAKLAIDEIERDAKDASLCAALAQSRRTSATWRHRIDEAVQEVGGVDEVENPILQAHYDAARKLRQGAEDDLSRDLGIFASHQLALHYWMAAFGTMKSYASQAGLGKVEQNMLFCLDDTQNAQRAQANLARTIMQQAA
ncbi:DUF892 family protein [Aureimonas sp. AU4]|uniref:DUF892 family protein n=1 Tax=Aureimonas sp. AU4 TaxID=1638163 RepID=UPI0007863B80|nr:DUF892 family protein [Aureimonas sp. AU4]